VEVVEEDDLNPNDSCLPGSSANPQIVVDWSDYSPALLKAPTSELLSLTSRSGVSYLICVYIMTDTNVIMIFRTIKSNNESDQSKMV
jgi:hypothetical protein